jgi:hypothetical protein
MSAFNPYFALLDNIVFLIGVKGFALREGDLGLLGDYRTDGRAASNFPWFSRLTENNPELFRQFRRLFQMGGVKLINFK